MEQIQSEPKKAKEIFQKIQEIAVDVQNQRGSQLKQAIHQCNGDTDLADMINFYQEIIKKMKNESPKIANFKLQIMIGRTCSWEAITVNEQGKRRLKFHEPTFVKEIRTEYQFNKVIIDENGQIKKSRTMKETCQLILYSYKIYLETFHRQKLMNSLRKHKLLVTLEHECCHNILRWNSKNKDPCLISPEKNDYLRIGEHFQEAGNYYAQMAYQIISEVSPFCINAKIYG